MMELKNEFELYKRIKKTIKRMWIKIRIQNKFYIWLNGEIEKKNQFRKISQKNNQKKDDQNWYKNKILIERWNWKDK
jgi:hypothetical protein